MIAAADKTLKQLFVAVTDLCIHLKSISPAKEICCSGLLIAHLCSESWLVPELRCA